MTNDPSVEYIGIDIEKIIVEKQLSLASRIFCKGNFESLKENSNFPKSSYFLWCFLQKNVCTRLYTSTLVIILVFIRQKLSLLMSQT